METLVTSFMSQWCEELQEKKWWFGLKMSKWQFYEEVVAAVKRNEECESKCWKSHEAGIIVWLKQPTCSLGTWIWTNTNLNFTKCVWWATTRNNAKPGGSTIYKKFLLPRRHDRQRDKRSWPKLTLGHALSLLILWCVCTYDAKHGWTISSVLKFCHFERIWMLFKTEKIMARVSCLNLDSWVSFSS
jgi:hypothetical protein